jgi:hypothetical protein
MINLSPKEGWFLFDTRNNELVRHSNGQIINYGIYDEALEDRYGNESILEFDELPIEFQEEYIKQEK